MQRWWRNMMLRDYQEEIVKRAVEALDNGRSVIINAPTGTGKTLMALETLRRLDKIGWVYVRTISEYSSWERDARKLGLTFSGLMRKGEFCKAIKRPYYYYCTKCDEEVGEEHLRIHKRFIERRYNNPLCFSSKTGLCRFRVENHDEIKDTVIMKMEELLRNEGIKGTANWFRDNKIEGEDVCVYKTIEGGTDIRIYSYIYFFLGIRKPDEDIVVFDEAHNLDDFNINNVTITLKEIINHFKRLRIEGLNDGTFLETVGNDFKEFIQDPERGFPHTEFLDEDLQKKFGTVARAWEEQDRWYIERDYNEWYIKVMPADPAIWLSILNDYRFILLSGTMPSPEYVKTVWGLNDFVYINALSLWSKTSLKGHFEGAKIFVDDTVYYIKNERAKYRKQIAATVRQYASKEGINLVIVPNYEELEAYKNLFFGAFFEDIRPDVLDRVKTLPDGSIVFAVAGGKLSEGVEVTENGKSKIKTVFVIGLPLPEYNNPYLDKMIETVSKRVSKDPNNFKWQVLYEKAVIKIKQAIGRAIRGPQDSANIYLIDKRFGYKNVMRLMNLEVA
ncbi:Rad3-like helicase [Betafusellovirus yellowstonense]|uniref:Rad3-like helicase n=1 Tax=Betafusellovirus yellowstonense TaxID=693629 RepID=D1GF97_9VIRU|nr:DNA helicase [Acidianus spindle-shaped virus 1]ACZ35798.1 Rad3-like helicase [Acidianus spindle-shaped virus 1]